MSQWQIFLDSIPWWAWVTVGVALVGIVVEVTHLVKLTNIEDDYAGESAKRSGAYKK